MSLVIFISRREFLPVPPPVGRVFDLVWDTPVAESFNSSNWVLPAGTFTLGFVNVGRCSLRPGSRRDGLAAIRRPARYSRDRSLL